MEGDFIQLLFNIFIRQFQSTPSAWRETINSIIPQGQTGDFNPLPPRGGRPNCVTAGGYLECISIHSLRVEGDLPTPYLEYNLIISIHSLRVEGDRSSAFSLPSSLRISIHSLRVEGDRSVNRKCRSYSEFQSTPSAWRETRVVLNIERQHSISIHSLRVEGDCVYLSCA